MLTLASLSKQRFRLVSDVEILKVNICLNIQTLDCIRRFDVVNRGMSGWNTAHAINYFENIFPASTETSPKMGFLVSHF